MKFNIHQNKFEELSTRPGQLAVAGSDGDLSWNQLYEKTQALCDLLTKLNLKVKDPVIIYGHKESYFVVAILSLMKLRIPYIPIDSALPQARIIKIQSLSNSKIIIDCSSKALPITSPIVVNRDANLVINIASPRESDKHVEIDDPLVYILFTSGSTGEPKGVQITRSSVLSFVDWIISAHNFRENEIYLNQAPFSFDVSLYDLYSFLHFGSSIVLTDKQNATDTDAFFKRLSDYKCSVWTSTPSFILLYLRSVEFNEYFYPQLKTFLFAGEVLSELIVRELHSRFPAARILNAYGPTEATVTTTLVNITPEMLRKYRTLPIGYPKNTSEILIEEADEQGHGELTIVGDHVSIGYFNDPEANQKKFYLHNGKRAFRTGDIGYYKDELLFFVGRNDEQIKLHGYRIEIGEINNELLQIPQIKNAVTVPLRVDNFVKRIIAFVQLVEDSNVGKTSQEDLILSLQKTLPVYMIPSEIVMVDSFPLNTNHKVDTKLLIENYVKGLLKS